MTQETCSVDECSLPIRNKARRLCNRHYLRVMRHGSVNYDKEIKIYRFIKKIDKSGDCWVWTGTKIKSGYGVVHVNGKRRYAHRVSYEIEYGMIPEGLVVDHLCRVPSCVRPSHLEAVTQAENVRRGVGPTAVNQNKTECIRGHRLSGSNLYVIKATGYRQCKACSKIRRMNDA